MARWTRREDPAYLAAMREAKVLFDAEMAKSVMKKGRPAGAKAAEQAAKEEEVSDESLDDAMTVAG